MRKLTLFLLLIFLSLLAYVVSNIVPDGRADGDIVKLHTGSSEASLPFEGGEEFTYEVRYQNIKIGKSVLIFNGEKKLDGKDVYHITFFTEVPNFRDTEELYADQKTFLPVEVHRTIKKRLGFNDRIVEKYDQQNFRVNIEQKSNLRSKNFSIQKDSPIHNAILLAYHYRIQQAFDKNGRVKIALPTIDFELTYKGIEDIETPLGVYRAHTFIGEPQGFELWLSADKERIPLKIENPGTLGYSLVIKEK